jgi:MFS family permease
MSAWPTDEPIAPRQRPRPKRWLLVAFAGFVACIVVPALAPRLEGSQDPTAPWAVAFVVAFAGIVVGIVGAIVAAVRARRFPDSAATQPAPSEPMRTPEDRAQRRAGRTGIYVALGGLALVIVTMVIREALVAPAPGQQLGPVEGTFVTIGVCVLILGLSWWGMLRTRAAAERRMIRNLEGAERIEPTLDEERALQAVFKALAARSWRPSRKAYWRAAAGNPTDVREVERMIPRDVAAVRTIALSALSGLGAEVLADAEGLLRAWWHQGGTLNGNPVVVTFAFEPDGLGGTRLRARSAVKFYLSNQDLAQEALDRILPAFDVPRTVAMSGSGLLDG